MGIKYIYYVGLLGFLFSFFSCSENAGKKNTDKPLNKASDFVKEGDLFFLGAEKKDTLLHLDIEIAENDTERSRGLMGRYNLGDTKGMLFIFDRSEEQSFWMKNTPTSLDIIYVGSDLEIVSIAKYTKPYSQESIPSKGPAQYVVEVQAGVCDKYNIKQGDRVLFERLGS